MNKLINWLKESNRLKHLKVGAIIFIGMFIIQYIEFIIAKNNITLNQIYYEIQLIFQFINSLITVFIAMCSVEYIQTTVNGKWDWLDVLAGCLIGILLTILLLIILLII